MDCLIENQLNDSNLFPRLEGQSLGSVLADGALVEHCQEHLEDDVEPWLDQLGAATHSGAQRPDRS